MVFKTFADGDVLTAGDVNSYLARQAVIVCTSGSRPSSPTEGMTIYETDTDLIRVHDGSTWQLIGWANGDRYARKTATESVTSSTVLQNDDALVVSVAANAVYLATVMLRYDGDVGGDLAIGWTLPASATFEYWAGGLGVTATLFTDDQTGCFDASPSPVSFGAIGAGTTCAVLVQGLLVTSGTSGTMQLRWAQRTAHATATRVFGNSVLSLRRLA